MKICVTSQGPELSSQVDPRFGRARYFVVYEDEDETFEAVDNEQNVNAAGGAGVQSATIMAEKGCEWVVSGHMGPKALSVLQQAGIRVATGASGQVQQALQDFADGKLEEIKDADVRSRW
jgi:predicted Fe-Mo cluster-binding NifX family protein